MCPLTGKSYLSRNWQIVGELNVQQDLRENKTLRGTVEVRCPCCEKTHAYPTEELVCPYVANRKLSGSTEEAESGEDEESVC
jgi:hypothetical protein